MKKKLCHGLLCILSFLLLTSGCAKSPETLRQDEETAFRAAIIKALDAGQSAILVRAPRRTAWMLQGAHPDADNSTIVLRPEMPSINGYAALVVAPGTYVLAGAGIVTNGTKDRRIGQTAPPPSQGRGDPLLGYVQKGSTTHQTVTTTRVYGQAVDQGPDYSFGLGLGHGFGSYGSRGYRGGFGYPGYYSGWGPRSWFGTSLGYAPSSSYRPVYTVEDRRNHVQEVYTLTLPNAGLTAAGTGPLVASFSVLPGEVLLLDTIYLSGLSGDFASIQDGKASPGENTRHASGLEFTIETFADQASRITPLGHPIITDRRTTLGPWLSDTAPGKGIERAARASGQSGTEAIERGQRERFRLVVK